MTPCESVGNGFYFPRGQPSHIRNAFQLKIENEMEIAQKNRKHKTKSAPTRVCDMKWSQILAEAEKIAINHCNGFDTNQAIGKHLRPNDLSQWNAKNEETMQKMAEILEKHRMAEFGMKMEALIDDTAWKYCGVSAMANARDARKIEESVMARAP